MLDYSVEEHFCIYLLMRGLQVTSVFIWIRRLSFSSITKSTTS